MLNTSARHNAHHTLVPIFFVQNGAVGTDHPSVLANHVEGFVGDARIKRAAVTVVFIDFLRKSLSFEFVVAKQ